MADNTGTATTKQISYLNALRAKRGLAPTTEAMTLREASFAISKIKHDIRWEAEITYRRAVLADITARRKAEREAAASNA